MKKKLVSVFTLLLAVLVCLISAGCSLNRMDIIVGRVGSQNVTAQDVTLYANYMLLNDGYSRSDLSADDIASLNQSALDYTVTNMVILQKATELGLYPLSADNQTKADDLFNQFVSSLVNNGTDPSTYELTEDNIKTLMTNIEVGQVLMAATVKDVSVTDDEIQSEYNQLLSSEKSSYDSDPTAYDSALSDGSTVVYRPAGYRYIKHILIAMPSDIESQITTANSNGDTSSVASLRQQGLAQIQDKANEVLAKVQSGGDFDALMAQYGEDPGMQADPGKTEGYQVGAKSNYVPEFLSAAMGLAKPGDTTGLVASDYGYHIIKYVGDVPPGPIPLDQVKDGVSASALAGKQSDAFNALVSQWEKELGVKENAAKIPVITGSSGS